MSGAGTSSAYFLQYGDIVGLDIIGIEPGERRFIGRIYAEGYAIQEGTQFVFNDNKTPIFRYTDDNLFAVPRESKESLGETVSKTNGLDFAGANCIT